MTGYLTTHVLDTAQGRPAAAIEITLSRLNPAGFKQVAKTITNADGRTDAPILPQDAFETGQYELLFDVGPYLAAQRPENESALFLQQIPIRFAMTEAAHYHVPLLLAPYGYSTYRGS
ncbi:MAG: hydroxyisourate hydrolase [Pseudomonadota bacterium]